MQQTSLRRSNVQEIAGRPPWRIARRPICMYIKLAVVVMHWKSRSSAGKPYIGKPHVGEYGVRKYRTGNRRSWGSSMHLTKFQDDRPFRRYKYESTLSSDYGPTTNAKADCKYREHRLVPRRSRLDTVLVPCTPDQPALRTSNSHDKDYY